MQTASNSLNNLTTVSSLNASLTLLSLLGKPPSPGPLGGLHSLVKTLWKLLEPSPPGEVTNSSFMCSLYPHIQTSYWAWPMATPKTAFPVTLPIVYSRHTGILAVPQNLHSHLPGVKNVLPGVLPTSSDCSNVSSCRRSCL